MKKGFERKIITTADGSHTLELVGMDEHYHSTFGAVQESRHVFIRHGLLRISEKETHVNILEVGFGTGLNAVLTLLESQKRGALVHYFTLEPFPLVKEEYELLNYPEVLTEGQGRGSFLALHQSDWEKDVEIAQGFVFYKSKAGLMEAVLPLELFNLVYYDAFGPDTQPGLWDFEVFEKVYGLMRPGGILVTYSTKGAVRRALKACGFQIEKLTGPPGKREMTRATKPLI